MKTTPNPSATKNSSGELVADDPPPPPPPPPLVVVALLGALDVGEGAILVEDGGER